jgi:hypothetical protein
LVLPSNWSAWQLVFDRREFVQEVVITLDCDAYCHRCYLHCFTQYFLCAGPLLTVVLHDCLRKLTYLFDHCTEHVRLAGECFARCNQFVMYHLEHQTIGTRKTILCDGVGVSTLTKVNAEATLSAALDVVFVEVGAVAH